MANRPKGKLFALLAVFAAIGLVAASGAFTSVTAERTANVTVAGDGAALLQLEPHGNSANGEGGYAQFSDNNELEISLAGFGDVDGVGVNQNATTDIVNVFNITNQGTQNVNVNISDLDTGDSDYSSAVLFYSLNSSASVGIADGGLETDEDHTTNITAVTTNPGSAIELAPGDTVQVSIYVDTTVVNSDGDLVDDIEIYAESTN